jgi:steroid Delta-isomerase
VSVPSAEDKSEAITKTVNRYLELVAKGSADELTALYVDDATIEDPVGSDVRRGRDAVHEFYAAIENLDKETELVSVKVAGNEAAFLWQLRLNTGGSRSQVEPISVMTFNDDAKITSMKAYWGPKSVTQL